jgi:hypothetical protein
MSGLTDYAARKVLELLAGKTAFALPTVYVALFTAVGSDDGTGFTEVSGGAYARVATAGATWNAASGSAPAQISNSAAVTFPLATADWGTAIAFGLYDAASGGNLLAWDYLGNSARVPFACSLASPGVLTAPAHGFSNGDKAAVTAEYGGALPATAGSWAGLLTVATVTTDTFTAGVNTTGTGSGMVRKAVSQAIPSGVQASFAGGAPGTLVLTGA